MGDNESELDAVMQKATSECDIVVTSGGVSMGELDLVKPYIEAKGTVFFGRINMKPGKPTTFGNLNKALVFALPGNPVSAFVTAHLFVVLSARLLGGQIDTAQDPTLTVQLIPRNVKVDPERPEYHRVVIVQDSTSGKLFAFSTGSQLSSRLLSAKSSNGFAILPATADVYHCSGTTKVLLVGPLVLKSPTEV